MLKLLTLPLWGPFWVVGALFRARATVRSGRRTVPVRMVTQVRPVVVHATVTGIAGGGTPFPPPPGSVR
jgi:hypothetical protein